MKREEVTALLRDILQVCDGINEEAVILMPPNADDVLSHGYQLHIKSGVSQEIAPCLKRLVEKRNLVMAYEPSKGNLLVIYRPLKEAATV